MVPRENYMDMANFVATNRPECNIRSDHGVQWISTGCFLPGHRGIYARSRFSFSLLRFFARIIPNKIS